MKINAASSLRYAWLLALGAFGAAHADVDAEAEALGRLQAELESLHALVRQAEAQSDPGSRVRFNYAALEADLKTIELGIEKYRAGQLDAPREVESLAGEYRR